VNQTETNHTHTFYTTNTRILSEIVVFVALATALSFIIVYNLPQGGSITAGSMAPLIWLSLRRGPKIGFAACALYGLIQFGILPYIAPSALAPIQVLMDYPLAFGVLGFAGFFQKNPWAGATVGIAGRFVISFISGVYIWAPIYAPDTDPYIYSAVYNGSYLLPELAITLIIVLLLQKSKVLNMYL